MDIENLPPPKNMNQSAHILIIVSLILCSCGSKQEQQPQTLMDASKQELATALGERDELLGLMREIITATNQIKHLENILAVIDKQPDESHPQRARVLRDIAAIQQTLSQRREQLAILEQKLQKSGLFNNELRMTIEALRKQIDSQSSEIANLKTQLNAANEHIDTLTCQVDSLNTTIFSVNERLAATQGTATRLENELNACYYIIASKSVLKESKILETGFLRKSKLLKGDFDKGLFVTCDKRYADSLDLQSDKARILTNHSEGSYEIVEQNGKKILHITSPEQFWDCSNYLVVQID